MLQSRKWIISLSILLLYCGRHPQPRQSTQISNGNYYECVLLAPIKSTVHCGVLSVAVAMKFKMAGDSKMLAIIFPCPEFYGRNFFTKGQTYKVKLTTDTSFCKGCTIIREYNSNLPSYYAMQIDKIYKQAD